MEMNGALNESLFKFFCKKSHERSPNSLKRLPQISGKGNVWERIGGTFWRLDIILEMPMFMKVQKGMFGDLNCFEMMLSDPLHITTD